jgi:endonuclease YncB( thermonuclease family)
MTGTRLRLLCGCALIFLTLTASRFAAAQTVTDGDTISLNGVPIRLFGIDAPEMKQDCPDGWPAGRLAATHLQSLMYGRHVTCERRDTDRYGRTVAVCRAGGEDLGALMVRQGYAWAFVRYSSDYVGDETRAKAERAGVHGHGCAPAWEWRAAQKIR